jgi:hypothetical protein
MRTRVNVLLTSSRSVAGLLDHGDARFSDALKNPLESIVRLTEATLGRIGNLDANEPVDTAVIPKNHVALVYAPAEANAPAERRLSGYVPKQTTELIVLVAGLRVRGHGHAAGELDPVELHRLVADGANRFVVLTDAHMALDVEGMTERAIGVAMLNARHIQFVARSRFAEDQARDRRRAWVVPVEANGHNGHPGPIRR